jgi:hypothetical protein
VRFAFDIGGVISKYPDLYRELIDDLMVRGHTIYILTDMHPMDKVVKTLDINGINRHGILIADYERHAEMSKDVLLKEYEIDFFFDDFIGYVVGDGAPIRCLVMPDAVSPYYHPNWKTVDGEADFGRRRYTKSQMKGKDA